MGVARHWRNRWTKAVQLGSAKTLATSCQARSGTLKISAIKWGRYVDRESGYWFVAQWLVLDSLTILVNFNSYIGIDYSGAAKPETRSATIQVYEGSAAADPTLVSSPASKAGKRRNWNRLELGSWLVDRLKRDDRCIVGIDHGFSCPVSYFQQYNLMSWEAFLEDFSKHWPTDQLGTTVQQYRDDSQRSGEPSELRLTEQWTSSAKSVFRFDVQGSVAKSTHAGLPFLKQMRDQVEGLHFWPFDGWCFPDEKSIVAETYPSLFRNRYPRVSRTVDQQDAYSICCWLRDMDQLGRLQDFASPPLSAAQKEIASLEGWILGVY